MKIPVRLGVVPVDPGVILGEWKCATWVHPWVHETNSWWLDNIDWWRIVRIHDGGNKISWRKKNGFHDVVSDSWRKFFSWRELYFITHQTIGLMTKGANSWRKVQNFMTENNGFHAVIKWFMTENYFMTGVWFHDGKKKSMTENKDVSWRILNFMTQKTFSWRKIDDFMPPKTFHDGKKVDF